MLAIEHGRLPRRLWEPAAGNGAILQPLRAAGFDVVGSDLVDYGGAGITAGVDYLIAPVPAGVTGIVTNPPFKLAIKFACKALDEVPYLALLLRTNFLEGTERLPVFPRAPADADLVELAALADDASPWLERVVARPAIPPMRGSCGMRAPPASPPTGSSGRPLPWVAGPHWKIDSEGRVRISAAGRAQGR